VQKSEIQLLFAYNDWANARLLKAAKEAGLLQYTAPAPLSHGSLRGTLVHVFAAEWVWRQVLVHVVNHGTQFRGEAAVLLSQYGYSPGDLDFIAFLRQRA